MIKKLAEGPVTMTIVSCAQVAGNFGPQVAFNGQNHEGDVTVFISEQGAMRQLQRLGLNPDTAVGQSLKFEQVQKDGRTFNNIYLADSAPQVAPQVPAPQAQAPAPQVAPPVSEDKMEAMVKLYGHCLQGAFTALSALEMEQGVAFTPDSIVAATATLFIQMNR